MSNPTTLVEPFSAIGGFTASGAVRFFNGLWLEEGRTNIVPNPTAASDTTGWSVTGANFAISRETSLPAPLPGWLASRVTTGFKISASANDTTFGGARITISPTATAHALSVWIYIPSSYTGSGVPRMQHNSFAGATGTTNAPASLALRDQWQLLSLVFTPDSGDLSGLLFLQISGSGSINSGDQFWIACVQAEAGAYPSSFILNSFGTGYSGTTTHIRAAASAAISPAGILAPDTGSLAFRFRRLIDTGGTETLLECGTDGASTDYLALTIDASDKLVMAWTANGGSAQTVTSAESIAVDTEYLLYVEWDGTQMAMSLDNGPFVTGVRDTPQGSWGAGDLVLKAE